MGQLGGQTVNDHLKRLVAQDPVKNNKLLGHYESLKGYSAKLNFALQLKVDRDGSFMAATEVHSTASMDKSVFFRMVGLNIQRLPASLACSCGALKRCTGISWMTS